MIEASKYPKAWSKSCRKPISILNPYQKTDSKNWIGMAEKFSAIAILQIPYYNKKQHFALILLSFVTM